jgi:hypothetical protein
MLIHPRERDLVVATYGRGLYVTNTLWLADAKKGAFDRAAHLFAVQPRPVPPPAAIGNFEFYGDRHLIVPNDDGLNFDYYLRSKADGAVKITIADAAGTAIRTIDGPGNAGMNRATWSLTGRGRAVEPGEYTVTLQAGGQTLVQKARVLAAGR